MVSAAKLVFIQPSKHLKGKISVPRIDERGRKVPRAHRRSAIKTLKMLAYAARHHGEVWYVSSSFRTRAKQEYLYEGYRAGKPGFFPANKPGTSKHELGLAVDCPALAVGYRRMTMQRIGFKFPYPKEPWHAER